MRKQGKNLCLFALLFANFSMPLCADAQGLDRIIEQLMTKSGYAASVNYAVTLPQAEDDVIYSISIRQPQPETYLIDWSIDTPSGPNDGFTAWFDGHFYNYRNHRLREYHAEWDSQPISGDRAVQHTVQFASLIPSEIARELTRMAADTVHYSITMPDDFTVNINRNVSGMTDAEIKWEFDPETCMPARFSAEYNPGAISEQIVHATYSTNADVNANTAEPLNEEWLRNRYPEVFENYRQSNFAIESMPGQQLPAFSLPLVFSDSGQRLTRTSSSGFQSPAAVIVLADPEATLTPRLIDNVRDAVARVPVDTEVIYAFTGRDPEINRTILGNSLKEGEKAVGGAKRLVADCGAAALPVVMVCDSNGTVKYVTVGLNNQLSTDVIKMITLSTTSSY